MPRLSAETHARRRRDMIVAAAAVLAQHPNASMAEIAEHAAIGRATLYRYFPTRRDLIRGICIEALDRTDAACAHVGLAPTCEAMVRQILEAVLPLGTEFHFLYRRAVGLGDPEVDRRMARQLEQTRQMFEWGKSTGEIAAGLGLAWLVRLFDGLIWMGWSAVAQGDQPVDAVIEQVFTTLWSGVARPRSAS